MLVFLSCNGMHCHLCCCCLWSCFHSTLKYFFYFFCIFYTYLLFYLWIIEWFSYFILYIMLCCSSCYLVMVGALTIFPETKSKSFLGLTNHQHYLILYLFPLLDDCWCISILKLSLYPLWCLCITETLTSSQPFNLG